jgi:hypothetical protein
LVGTPLAVAEVLEQLVETQQLHHREQQVLEALVQQTLLQAHR